MHHLTTIRRSLLLLAVMSALGLYLIAADGRITVSDGRFVVGIGIVSSLIWLFRARGGYDNRQMYEAGRQSGYEAGYGDGFVDGRKVARPVVVEFPPRPDLAVVNDS